MPKITFLGAGSTVFAKNILGDCMQTPALQDSEIALYDIDLQRLRESKKMLQNINDNCNDGRASIKTYYKKEERKDALKNADYVVNAIQVGGYRPCTVTDFEIPKKYGLRQTIGDTLGIGGIFRTLRTVPVMLDFARDMEEVCPDAWLLNYTNPMSMLTGALLQATDVNIVGLCHSVQVCADTLLNKLDMETDNIKWKVAGINHMGWLLEISRNGKDLYPEIRKKVQNEENIPEDDKVRFEMLRQFGYYVTESSEHNAEYLPYFIKDQYPELIDKFNIPLDEYPRRCENQIARWQDMREDLVDNNEIEHSRTHEYASYIMEAMETDEPYKIGGNVLNNGLIPNLPDKACVEVPCMVDGNGVNPCYVGELPPQLAALNRTNVNVDLLTIKAALTKKKEYIHHAALLDPHTSSELSIDEINSLVEDMIEAHGNWLPEYK